MSSTIYLSQESKRIACFCFFNEREVSDVFNIYKEFCKGCAISITYESFCHKVKCDNITFIKRYFVAYKELEWEHFFRFICCVGFLPLDVSIMLIITIYGFNYEGSISLEIAMTVLSDTANEKYLEIFRKKHASEYPLPFEQFKNFLKKHPIAIYKWQKIHHEIQCLIIKSKHRRKEIHGRLQHIFYRESYKAENNGIMPCESCSNKIKRLINRDPYPYKYDYELDIIHKNEILANLIQYYKIIFQYHYNINRKENPLIDYVKKNGDITTTTSTIMCGRAPQNACTPTRSRSRVNSSYTSKISTNDEDDDRSINFSVSRTLTRAINPKTVVIKPMPSTSTLQVQHSSKLTQIMKSFHEHDGSSFNNTSNIPGKVNESVE